MRSWSSSFLSFCASESFSFSDFQRAVRSADFFSSAASSVSSPLSRAREPGSRSFFSASCSILSRMISRSIEFELFRLGIDLHLQPRRRLVDEVDRLVGQEAVGDVAMRQRRRGDQRAVGDAHAVMRLVLVLEPAQDRDRVLDARLVDEDRLETARQRGVLLDVLLVFVERGGADAVQFAARQRRLEQVRGIHRAVGLAGADDGVHLVDEQDVGAGRGRHFLQHRLEPFLELAAIFRAGDHRAHVERKKLLVLPGSPARRH